MNGVITSSGLSASTKIVSLTKHTKHPHIPSPVAPKFTAPAACIDLSFQPLALAAAVARTATTWDDAPRELLDGLQQSALVEVETLLQDGSAFSLKPCFKFLADTAGSQLAAKVGGGTIIRTVARRDIVESIRSIPEAENLSDDTLASFRAYMNPPDVDLFAKDGS